MTRYVVGFDGIACRHRTAPRQLPAYPAPGSRRHPAILRDQVLEGGAFPQTVVRVGWAQVGSNPLPATPRRPLDDVLGRFPD
jgi:hypothetical protein